MNPQIDTKFDKSVLPRPAQRIAEVVEIAKRDLAFRADVIAKWNDPAWRYNLIQDAKRRYQAIYG